MTEREREREGWFEPFLLLSTSYLYRDLNSVRCYHYFSRRELGDTFSTAANEKVVAKTPTEGKVVEQLSKVSKQRMIATAMSICIIFFFTYFFFNFNYL